MLTTGCLYGSLTCWLEESWLSSRVWECGWTLPCPTSCFYLLKTSIAPTISARLSASALTPTCACPQLDTASWRTPTVSAPVVLHHWVTAPGKTRHSDVHFHIDQCQWNQHPNGHNTGIFPLASAATLLVSEALWCHSVCLTHQSLIDHLLKSCSHWLFVLFDPL